MARPTRTLVNLNALRHNFSLAQSLAGSGKCMPIVKANAYGHGAVTIARALEPLAPALGVACIEEALELRQAGISVPILLLEGFFSSEELQLAAEHELWLMLQSDWQLQALATATLSKPLKAWLKIDTGMHRLGFPPAALPALYQQLSHMPQVAAGVVLATHFASADDLDSDATATQIKLFQKYTQGIDAPHSLANSPALLAWPEARAHWNRPGFLLYGVSPFNRPHPQADKLQPVMTLRSEIISVRTVKCGDCVGYGGNWTAPRDSLVATVPVGYGDGYPRHAGNATPVLIEGRRAPLVGRVSMDMITVDVTDLPQSVPGAEVILWGENPGVDEVAEHAGTIAYELLTRIQKRVHRQIID